jgi:hypothetical protein
MLLFVFIFVLLFQTTKKTPVMQIVPFSQHVEIFNQELTIMGTAEIVWGEDGREFGAITFTSIGVNGYSEELKEVVFTAVIPVKDLSHKALLELENALIDQHGYEIMETLAAEIAA